MTTFDERENAFEAKYAHDEEMNFKVQARANRMLAEWAAGFLGREGAALESYIREVIAADFKEAGDEDVIAKVAADLEGKAGMDEVRAKRAEFVAAAKAEIIDAE